MTKSGRIFETPGSGITRQPHVVQRAGSSRAASVRFLQSAEGMARCAGCVPDTASQELPATLTGRRPCHPSPRWTPDEGATTTSWGGALAKAATSFHRSDRTLQRRPRTLPSAASNLPPVARMPPYGNRCASCAGSVAASRFRYSPADASASPTSVRHAVCCSATAGETRGPAAARRWRSVSRGTRSTSRNQMTERPSPDCS